MTIEKFIGMNIIVKIMIVTKIRVDVQEINRLRFYILEYFNEKHPDINNINRPQNCYEEDDGMFRFEKVMK